MEEDKERPRIQRPITSELLWVMAETIVEKQKATLSMSISDVNRVDWDLLTEDWEEWLRENLLVEIENVQPK